MHSYRSEGYPAVTPWFEFTGLQSTGHGPQLPIDISFIAGASPITEGLADWRTVNEELYNNSAGRLLDSATPLARGRQMVRKEQAEESTADFVVVWTNNYGSSTKVATST
jgi:hypothetical protein